MVKVDNRLKCQVNSIRYDFETRSGVVNFPSGNCCDMGGCIRMFLQIDPLVVAIQCYSGECFDVRYSKQSIGLWVAEEVTLKKVGEPCEIPAPSSITKWV